MKLPLLAAALACVSLVAIADEADVKKAVEAKFGKVEKIVRAPMAGMWEVTVDGQILYADDKAGYVIYGNVLEMKTGRNLTAERMKDIEKTLVMGAHGPKELYVFLVDDPR